MSWRILTASIVAPACIAVVAICVWVFSLYPEQPGPLSHPTTIIITPGSPLAKITQTLAKNDLISYPLLFAWHVRMSGESQNLQAGEYHFEAHVSPRQIVNAITQGQTVKHAFTVPEGTTTVQVLEKLTATDLFTDAITVPIAEGELLPETYYFSRDEPRNKIIKRMHTAMTKTLQQLWNSRATDLPLTSTQDALILSSIVEKETKIPEERPRIAAVLLNRLKKGMKLQADPTVIYGLNLERTNPVQQLSSKDLEHVSPYNTYLHVGLPPTPICNPGKASIEAVLHPTETDELFFVADGTGGHVFSKTYHGHKQHHQNWRKIRNATSS